MGRIQVEVCSNCGRTDCDGRTYRVDSPGWTRIVCHGSDGDRFTGDNPPKYHMVMGHGNEYDVPLIEVENE